ncbi:3-phosphoserine/phosphohydroxythreonine transaminase [Wenzhouxiangella marina]|uniref:Phosphoserine aminotransferase n=1 Tax=Wenzhouxiangella marina TaxID=1579979 RepID=A0A0K0XVQ3_9GAMM|nr:3-phosphoserine/phosphohydroxythreonine transaminase [Wenzhouxiangella marina]AKS41696.1 MFS transporter [Wenzhouxiangella marina]MBB6086543.1 phosphoserine aminotransferase [Wenzhouxiangella marina]
MKRHNFSAGPAMLPVEVRQRLAEALAPSADGSPSIAEVSHRGPRFAALAEELEHRLRALMGLGDSHALLLLQGGANLQFAWLPMNLAVGRTPAYLISGHWGLKALAEARRLGPAEVVGSSERDGFRDVPEVGHLPEHCAYLHYTGNETIHGVQFEQPPTVAVPLAADLSSEFLSRPYPYADLAFAYAGAQKNLGIAGLTVVSIRRDLLARIPDGLPRYLDYRSWVESDSMYNTPVTLSWYVALEVCRWIEESRGGLTALAERNRLRAERLYRCIDESGFWSNPVAPQARSVMNVPFFPASEDHVGRFLEAAEAAGLMGLKGHRALGGLRASLYNALDDDSVETLIDFLGDYERRFG